MQEHVGGQGAEERGRRSSETTNLENFDDQLKNSSFNVKGVIMFNLFERLQKFKNSWHLGRRKEECQQSEKLMF